MASLIYAWRNQSFQTLLWSLHIFLFSRWPTQGPLHCVYSGLMYVTAKSHELRTKRSHSCMLERRRQSPTLHTLARLGLF